MLYLFSKIRTTTFIIEPFKFHNLTQFGISQGNIFLKVKCSNCRHNYKKMLDKR
jgi:hypothetical protein